MAKKILYILLIFIFPISIWAQLQRTPDITIPELLEHVKYLSSDKLEGRKTGTAGAELAYKFIAEEFKSYGLLPAGNDNSYFQKFEFVSEIRLGLKNEFKISDLRDSSKKNRDKVELIPTLNQDYLPLGFSSDGEFSGEIVFAGYGIVSPENNYDDYKDVNVKDKAVIIVRGAPGNDSTKRVFEKYSSLRYKANKAEELGAKALIVVTSEKQYDKDELMKLSYDRSTGRAGILVINITRALFNKIFANSEHTIKKITDYIDSSIVPYTIKQAGIKIFLKVELNEVKSTGVNVLGMIQGNDAKYKHETLILGAHYDHIGYGGENSGSLKPDTFAIHPGADDNASGVSGLLELAQFFIFQRDSLKRSMLFIAFAGEEMGLLGSGYYVKNPTIPIESSIAMLNFDMIGGLRNKKLIIYGMGTSTIFDSLVKKHNEDAKFDLKLNSDGYGPSDHSSFYSKQIPVMHFFTDLNEYYHRPYDTYDKLNYAGLHSVVQFVSSIALDLSTMQEKPKYLVVETSRPQGFMGRNMRVYVGTIPDFGEQVDGMKISGVRAGSPAANAGLIAGDVIIKFGKVDVKNIYDYTYAIGEYKAGDVVDVIIRRNNELLTLKVTLEKRN